MDNNFENCFNTTCNEQFDDNLFVCYLHAFYKIKKNKLKEIFIQSKNYEDFTKRIKQENIELFTDIETNADFSHPPTGSLEDINAVRNSLGFSDIK